LLLALGLAGAAIATPQIPGSTLVKSQGKWSYLSRYPHGATLHIVDKDTDRHVMIGVRELLPEEEFWKFYTTAGPKWGEHTLWYITRLGDRDVFRARTRYKTDILIDLEKAKPIDAKPWQARLKELDEKWIREILRKGPKPMQKGSDRGQTGWKVRTALVHAIHRNMTDCIAAIRAFEEIDAIEAGVLPSGSDPFTKQPPIDEKASYWHYTAYGTRRLAVLALRRLGAVPKGYRPLGFLPEDRTRIVTVDALEKALPKIKRQISPKDVYRELGPPDYVAFGSWRYDLDATKPYSVRVIWDDDGVVKQVEKVSPPLWRTELQDSVDD